MTLNGFTTAPAIRYSILSRPPAILLTRSTYCIAMSLKMSVAPQAPCILSVTVWAREMLGAASAAVAPAAVTAAPLRNLRRDDAGSGSAAGLHLADLVAHVATSLGARADATDAARLVRDAGSMVQPVACQNRRWRATLGQGDHPRVS